MNERNDDYSDDEVDTFADKDDICENAVVGGCALEFEWMRRTKVWPSPSSYPPPPPVPYSLPPAFFAALGGGDRDHAHSVGDDQLAALAGAAVDDGASVAPDDHLRGALDV